MNERRSNVEEERIDGWKEVEDGRKEGRKLRKDGSWKRRERSNICIQISSLKKGEGSIFVYVCIYEGR